MDKEITDLQYEYLKDVLNELSGIGEARAARIICTQTTFSDFENIQKQTLIQIRGITSEKSQEITERFNRIDFSRSARILYTEKVLKSFVDTQYEKVENIDLDDLNINVLLIKALGFTTVEETIEFYIYQRITRSVVTSWGSKALEEICMISGAEDISSSENVKMQGKNSI
jgi:ribosomal protein S13